MLKNEIVATKKEAPKSTWDDDVAWDNSSDGGWGDEDDDDGNEWGDRDVQCQ